jgi:hypothetical protein
MFSIIHVTAWERKSLGRRALCAVLRVGMLVGLVLLLFTLLGPPLAIFFTTKSVAKRSPDVWVTQRPLVNYAVSGAEGTPLSYFGYGFEVPWTDGFKEKKGKNLVQLQFDSGQNVTFIVPSNQAGILSEIVEDPSLHMGNLQSSFAGLTTLSAYDQYATLLNTTPSNIRAFGPGAEAARGEILLIIKAIALPPTLATGAFSFDLPDKHGFQIGDPQKARRADLEVFEKEGNSHVEIICATINDNVRLTQPELNRILKSFHPELAKVSASASPGLTQQR